MDDNFLNRVVLVSYLEGQGYHVAQAENGRQGLTELRVNDYDLLLLDILMPEMDGFQVLHAIRRDNRLRSLPVIVTSAVDEMESITKSIQMGADDYILKPFAPSVLASRIAACLEKRRRQAAQLTSSSASARVLVADPHHGDRVILGDTLKELGHRLVFANSGEETLEALRMGGFHLLILDIMIPGKDGQAVVKAMHDEGLIHRVPVILTGRLNELDRLMACIDLGASDYVLKPFVPETLIHRVNAALANKG